MSNSGLVNNLWKNGLLSTPRVRDAFNAVDRAHFCLDDRGTLPYEDAPQMIGFDATISAPHIHAAATEALEAYLQPGMKALDIGSGSGYLCAIFSHLVGPEGKVIGVDHIKQLVDFSKANMKKDPTHAKMLEDGAIELVKADGRLGYAKGGPYNAIHVGAAANSLHQELIDQLACPGKMFIPVESGYAQYIWEVTKDESGNVKKEKKYGVLFVPLTDEKKYVDPVVVGRRRLDES